VTDRPLRLVLDPSAVAAWTRGSLAVGELLAEIDEEGGAVGIPLPCLTEVASQTHDDGRTWLDLLVRHRAAVILPDDPADWRMLAGVLAIIGRPSYPLASTAWHALELGVDILTSRPGDYEGLDADLVLPFREIE
jgi:hypothetical protein